ncbi:MAG: c-type cytochrome biogenesis protein CcmI [Ponticaulis sp.]|nr:c-type cytochrome biogenesis protein CcmI [Ponticaulis sp.]
MIWIILLGLVGLSVVLVLPALIRPSSESAREAITRELDASKTQLSQIEAEIDSGFLDEQGAARAKRAMERRILALGDRLDALDDAGGEPALPIWIKLGVPAVLAISAFGLYPLVGSPNYSPQTTANRELTPEEQAIADMSLPEIEALLVQRIQSSGSQDPTGFVYLARVRMDMGKFDDALEAYQTAAELSDNNPNVVQEIEQARAYIERVRSQSPSSAAPDIESGDAADMANSIREMTPEQQQAQIRSMVDGLAVRLEDNPDDLQGWLRLIRARTVLGESEVAADHLADARAAFDGNPEALAALNQLETELEL